MPIYHNIDGVWKPAAAPPAVNIPGTDTEPGGWRAVTAVHARTHGSWRRVWPEPDPVPPIITITAPDTAPSWTEDLVFTVAITGIDIPQPGYEGSITVSCATCPGDTPEQGWNDTFDASDGSKEFTVTGLRPGTYPITATWSKDPMITATVDMPVRRAVPTVTLSPETQNVEYINSTTITTTITFERPGQPSVTVPAGGTVQLRRQTTTDGIYTQWLPGVSYGGHPIVHTVLPDDTIGWQSRIVGHPNFDDSVSNHVITVVRTRYFEQYDVEPVLVRTYNGDGTLKQTGWPVYYGKRDERYGLQRGVIWLPGFPLGEGETCSKVEALWQVGNVGTDGTGNITFGYHNIEPADLITIVDSSDGKTQWSYTTKMNVQENDSIWVEVTPVGNNINSGDTHFGITVGGTDPDEQYSGYGRFLAIRYHVERLS